MIPAIRGRRRVATGEREIFPREDGYPASLEEMTGEARHVGAPKCPPDNPAWGILRRFGETGGSGAGIDVGRLD